MGSDRTDTIVSGDTPSQGRRAQGGRGCASVRERGRELREACVMAACQAADTRVRMFDARRRSRAARCPAPSSGPLFVAGFLPIERRHAACWVPAR